MDVLQRSASSGVALYYPTIHIQDLDWLKLSLLYFDRVRRIVPLGAKLRDPVEVRRLVEHNLLKTTPPNEYIADAADLFEKKVISLWQQGNPEALAILKRASQAFIDNSITTKKLHLEKLHLEKITHNLSYELKALGIAQQIGDWLELDAHIAGAYMMCLASVMSHRMNTPVVTDNPNYAGLGEYLLFGKVRTPTDQDPPSLLLKLGITLPSYEALKDVPIEKLIAFHERYQDERKRFRDAVESIQNKTRDISDSHELEDFLHSKENEIKSAIQDFEGAIGCLNIQAVGSFLSISFPTAVVWGAGAVGGSVALPLMGAGLVLGFCTWWAGTHLNHRAALSDTPEEYRQWHYLLSAKKNFPEPSPWQNEIGGTLGMMP